MKKIRVYTMQFCPYCERAKKLLKSKGFDFEEILVDMDDDATWDKLERETGFKTMPQIFFGEKFIGGFMELSSMSDDEIKSLL